MKRIYLVDLDGTVVEPGTHTLLPNVLTYLRKMEQDGEIWLFSSWAFNEADLSFLRGLGVNFTGIIPKPVADEYIVIDDKLNTRVSRRALLEVPGSA